MILYLIKYIFILAHFIGQVWTLARINLIYKYFSWHKKIVSVWREIRRKPYNMLVTPRTYLAGEEMSRSPSKYFPQSFQLLRVKNMFYGHLKHCGAKKFLLGFARIRHLKSINGHFDFLPNHLSFLFFHWSRGFFLLPRNGCVLLTSFLWIIYVVLIQ